MAFNLFYALFCSFGCQQKHYIEGNIVNSLETLMMLNVNHLNVKIRRGFFIL